MSSDRTAKQQKIPLEDYARWSICRIGVKGLLKEPEKSLRKDDWASVSALQIS